MNSKKIIPITVLKGSSPEDALPVKSKDFNSLWDDVKDLETNTTPTYTKYVALLTQSSINNPTVIVLENTLSGAIVWTRQDKGYYVGTLTGAFIENKTFLIIQKHGLLATNVSSKSQEAIRWNDANEIAIFTADENGDVITGGTDGILNNHSIEIRVY